jgi:ribonuclease D
MFSIGFLFIVFSFLVFTCASSSMLQLPRIIRYDVFYLLSINLDSLVKKSQKKRNNRHVEQSIRIAEKSTPHYLATARDGRAKSKQEANTYCSGFQGNRRQRRLSKCRRLRPAGQRAAPRRNRANNELGPSKQVPPPATVRKP